MSTLADAIAKVRLVANDAANSKRVYPDSLQALVDKTRTVFPLSNKNIVSTGAKYSQDGGALTTPTTELSDAVNGIVTMLTAPQTSLDWYYFYQDFTDAEITSMVDSGLGEVGLTETGLSTIDPTLFEVMAYFAAAMANGIRMERFASSYNASIEGESFEKSSVYKAYLEAHDSNYKMATEKREEFYKRQGRRFVSATAKTTVSYPPDNLLPRR